MLKRGKNRRKGAVAFFVQSKVVNEHFKLVFDEVSASTRYFEQALKKEVKRLAKNKA